VSVDGDRFAAVRTYMHSTNGGEWEFLEMELR